MRNLLCNLLAALLSLLIMSSIKSASAQTQSQFTPGTIWKDTQGEVINAHDGGLLYSKGRG